MELSEYELRRLENIRQNQKILEALEIPKPLAMETAAGTSKTEPAKKSTTKPKPKRKPKPTRVSARLRAKQEEEKNGGRRRKVIVLLKELSEPPKKPKKPRPLPGSKVPFEPEHGATDSFIRLMAKVSINDSEEKACLRSELKMAIRNQRGVTKVLQERIYSVALHPTRDKIIAATGGKEGHLAIWDATAVYEDYDPIDYKPRYFLFRPHSSSISTLRFTASGELLSSGYEGSIQAMNMQSGHHETIYVAPNSLQEQYISAFDLMEGEDVMAFSDMSGFLSILDRRAPSHSLSAFALHPKKIGGMSVSPVCPDRIATCSLDDTVVVWDRRMLKAEESVPLARFEYKRAVTAVNWHPTDPECLVSTCYDDHVRIHRSVLTPDKCKELSIRHNNQTGRWITTFKAYWDPKSTDQQSYVVVGDMNRGLDLIDGASGITHNFTSEYLTAQPAVNGTHPTLDLHVSGNASGKLALWTNV